MIYIVVRNKCYSLTICYLSKSRYTV